MIGYYLPADAESGVKDKSTSFDQPVTLQPIPMDRKMTFKSITGKSYQKFEAKFIRNCFCHFCFNELTKDKSKNWRKNFYIFISIVHLNQYSFLIHQ